MKTFRYYDMSSYMQTLDIVYADSGFYYRDRGVCELYIEGESLAIVDHLNNFTRSMCKLGIAS